MLISILKKILQDIWSKVSKHSFIKISHISTEYNWLQTITYGLLNLTSMWLYNLESLTKIKNIN